MSSQTYLYLYSEPTITFVTINGTFPVVARSNSNGVPSDSYNYFNDGLLSFQTENDTQQDVPSATITLTDEEDWASLLVPNDYVKIDMKYRSNAFSDEADQIISTCLYCGLISDIRKQTAADSNTREYIITVSGIAKIMSNITLTTFSELTSTLSSYQLLPDDAKTGIRFSQRTSANIIKQVLTKFITGTNDFVDYDFTDVNNTSYTTKQILNWSDSTIIENLDESFQNSTYNKFSNYNGTILQMVQDIAARPFNELYWTHEEGVATFHYRPTPFDQENWNQLARIQISTDDVLEEALDVTDQDQYSIFKLLSESTLGSETYSGGWSGHLAPLTNKELIRRYGYKTMEVETDYFNGNSSESSSVANSGSDSNQNLTSQAKSYASIVKSTCDSDGCSDLYPYAMAILQLELKSGASSTDPANAVKHGASSISTAKQSINYLVSELDGFNTKASDSGITDKLVAVQCYNFGGGFITYLVNQNAKSLSITYTINYSKKLAKANGNTSLKTSSYNTAVSNTYGKNYLYNDGGNFYYAYEAKQYLGTSVSSSSNTSSNSNSSNSSITEEQAQQSYPPYDSIEDVFAKAEGRTTNDVVTIPSKYGGSSTYDEIISYLTKYSDRSTFVSKATGLDGVITKSDAEQIYSQYHTSSFSGATNKMNRSRYLNIIAPQYTPTDSNISSEATYLSSYKKIKANPKKAAIELMEELDYAIGSKQAYEIIETWLNNNGSISSSEYSAILSKYPYNDTEDGVDPMNDGGTMNDVPYLFRMYTIKLFNWYADNSKYHSGNITINGTSGIEIGKRLIIWDSNDGVYWEYYIESVSHDYSVESGWKTIVGVTRGLPLTSEDDQRRFTYPYSFTGHYYPFRGGYFGENDLATAESLYSDSDSSSSSSTDDSDESSSGSDSFESGSSTGKAAYEKALTLTGKSSVWKASYQNTDPFSESGTIYGTCSQLVYWAYKHCGVTLGSDSSHTTWVISGLNNVTTIGSRGSNKSDVYNKIKEGDMIFFDTEGSDTHIAIAGRKNLVGFNSSGLKTFNLKSNSYWWGAFKGHVVRAK